VAGANDQEVHEITHIQQISEVLGCSEWQRNAAMNSTQQPQKIASYARPVYQRWAHRNNFEFPGQLNQA
jgi:hypothetical protein